MLETKVKVAKISHDKDKAENDTRSEDISRLIHSLIYRINKLEELVSELSKKINSLDENKHIKTAERESSRTTTYKERKRVPEKSKGVSIMQKQGVLFESDLKNIRDRNKFFDYLRRNDIVVIEGNRERVAVTKRYLNYFMSVIQKFKNPTEVETKLRSRKMKRLYEFLRDSGLLIYDSKKGWNLSL